MFKTLFEGMREGDLEDLVLPLVSVDEYESKIDGDAIVIGFYVSESDAAADLNRFLQRSAVELLDTEVSPAPDAQGYYMVFVELLNNDMLPDNVTTLLEEVAAVSNIESWKMQIRGIDELEPYCEKKLTRAIVDPEEDDLAESIRTFLTPSDLDDAVVWRKGLTLSGLTESYAFEIVGFGPVETVLRDHKLDEAAVSLSFDHVTRCCKIATMLGEGWAVHRVGDTDVFQHALSLDALVLRPKP